MSVRAETTAPPDTPSSDGGAGGGRDRSCLAHRGDSVGKDNSSDAPASVFDNNDHQDAPLRPHQRPASGGFQ